MQNSPDDEYKQKFLEEPWIKNNPYINPNLIQAHLPSFKYFFTECQELKNHVLKKFLIMFYQNQIYLNQKMPKIYVEMEFPQNICTIFY